MQHSGQGDLSSVIKEKRQKSEKIADMVKSTEEALGWTDSVSLLLYFLPLYSLLKSSPNSEAQCFVEGWVWNHLLKDIWELFCFLHFCVYSPQQVIISFLGQMVDAFFYIHTRNIFHRWVAISCSLFDRSLVYFKNEEMKQNPKTNKKRPKPLLLKKAPNILMCKDDGNL